MSLRTEVPAQLDVAKSAISLISAMRSEAESQTLDLLVTVKAYPQASDKYGEAVCVAGIRLDGPPSWVRLYPIEFRDLPWTQRFRKYDRIRLGATRRFDDRPESYFPDETIDILENISPRNGWEKRREMLEGLEVYTMCELQRRQARDDTSLGMVEVGDVPELEVEPRSKRDVRAEAERLQAVRRQDLFTEMTDAQARKALSPLEPFPYYVRYVWTCATKGCSGHRQSIIDWEIVQAWRSWRAKYGEDEVWKMIEHRWVAEMFAPDRTTRLFAGNMHSRPRQFLVLGVFWPPTA